MIDNEELPQLKLNPSKNIGRGLTIKRPTSIEKLYKCNCCIYIYPDGKIEIAKKRYGSAGEAQLEYLIPILTRVIADIKLKGTKLDMFKEGLSELLQEAMKPILEGDHYERTICG